MDSRPRAPRARRTTQRAAWDALWRILLADPPTAAECKAERQAAAPESLAAQTRPRRGGKERSTKKRDGQS